MALIRKPGLALKKPLGVKKPLGGGKPLSKPGKASGFGAVPKANVSKGGAFSRAATERTLWEEKRNQPYRVSIGVGKSLEVYFLDGGEPWTRYEHTIGGGPKSRGTIVPCIKDSGENCPACGKEGKEGAFVMFLSAVIPVETYTNKNDETITRRFQKRLFPIKIKMSRKYERLYREHGTFRGMVVKIHRDGQMDAGTGNDVEFVRMMSESEIKKLAANPPIKDKEKRDAAIKSKLDEAFDYDKMMPRPDAKKLSAMVGSAGNASAGSSDFAEDDDDAEEASGWGDDDGAED